MWERLLINIKISNLSCKIKALEKEILDYSNEAKLVNDLYYCGRGELNAFTEEWCNYLYWKIAACQRLIDMYGKKLDKLDGVVGRNSNAGKIFKN